MDPDRPFRTELVRDVRRRVAALGAVDAILLVGDVAYSGRAEEYSAALAWLTELAAAAGCSLNDVFVVPGNHDVDRDVIKRQTTVRNAQQAIISARVDRRPNDLLEQFSDLHSGAALLSPISAYNEFAARFNCQVYAPEKLFWHQERSLGAYRLRFYGLTSTLLSSAGVPSGREDTRTSLYLSPLQTVLDPVEGVINAVLCHHPPDWFMDQDEVEDAFRGRAALHFFGHKHRQRMYIDPGYVRFAAGAVNPDRNETGWEPGYNLIALSIDDDAGQRWLSVEAHLFAWQTSPDCFRPKVTLDGSSSFRHRIRLRDTLLSITAGHASAPVEVSVADEPLPRPDREVAMSEPHMRNLVFSFWKLASSQRREIALRLKLISEEDMAVPEPERYGRALLRASERGLLDELTNEVRRLKGGPS